MAHTNAVPPATLIPPRMIPRISLLRQAIVPAIALLAAASTAEAQVSRDWSVCFASGVASCTDLYLTTTASMGGAGGSRDGTIMSLMVRQRDRGVPTGLLAFSLGFGTAASDQSDALNAIPTPVGGAQLGSSGLGWTLVASRSTTPGFNYLYGSGGYDPLQAPSPTAWIGGCQSPSSNAWWSVDNVACGSGQAFSFQWTTSAFFDADQVQTVGADVVAIDQHLLFAGDGGGYCQGSASGGLGVGFDGYDPSNAYPCEITSAQPPVSTVPEPTTIALFAAGLAVLGGFRLRGTRPGIRRSAA